MSSRMSLRAPGHEGITRTVLVAALAVLAFFGSVSISALWGQQILAGRTIEEVRFEGLVTLAEDSLAFYLNLEPGQTYDPRALNAKLKELWGRELVDDVEIVAEPTDAGVRIVVRIVERPILVSLDYEGQKKLKRSDIGDHLDRERVAVYEGLPLNRGELARLKAEVAQLYADSGYRFADIDIQIEPVSESEVRVLVSIDEGNKVKIGNIQFEGNEVFSTGKLQSQMKKTKESGLISKIRKRDVYNPATVEEDLGAVKEIYRAAGYKDVQIGDPEVEVIEKNPKAATAEERKRQLSLVIPVEEGPRWKLGEIRFQGNEIFRDTLLTGVFAEPKGGWLRQDVISEGVERIQEFYNNTGYLFAQVTPEIVEADPDNLVADVVITIEENDQFRVGRIEFEGNDRTKDRVLRRELRLQEGMVFNAGALKNSLLKITQLEYFKLNEDEPVELDYKPEEKEVDLVIKGTEAERTELQFGGGYSELDGFFAQAALRTRNFRGRGETLGLSLQTGRYRNMFDLSYFVPWFRDRPQSIGAQLFKRDLDYDQLLTQRVRRNEQGVVLTYGRSFGLFQSVSFSYTNSDLEDFRSQTNIFVDPDPETGEFPSIQQEFSFNKSSITTTYGYDSHDSRLEPTRGRRVRASFEWAGGVLGGEDFFLRPTLNLAYTRPLTTRGLRTVGRINLSTAWIFPYGTEDGVPRNLFYLNRFFLGGENTIRGYAFRSIWVRDEETNETIFDESGFPQGGDKMFHLNTELHFLVAGPLRVVAFFDVGNVYGDQQRMSFSHVRSSAGLELRINVPLFGAPLRFIYAENLDPLSLLGNDQERFESFDFSIGTSF